MIAFIEKLQNLPDTKKKIILFSVVGVCGLVIGFFQVRSTFKQVETIKKSVQTISFPVINISTEGNKLGEISKLLEEFKQAGGLDDSMAGWQTYRSEKYGFGFSYPSSWQLDADRTTDLEVVLVKAEGKEAASEEVPGISEQAGIHIELASQTQKITSAEAGIDGAVAKMKQVILPKQSVAFLKGYEAIGTLCAGTCNDSNKDTYYPFSVTYLDGGDGQVIEIQYGEATDEIWKKDMKEWKWYDQFKKIVSTFNYIK